MRFASIGGQSNYAQAGKAVANDAAKTFDAARKNSVDFGGLAQEAMKVRSKEKIAAMKAEAAVTKTAINAKAYGKVKDAKRDIAKSGVMRKAGGLIALGMDGFRKEEKTDYSSIQNRIDRDRKEADEFDAQSSTLRLPESPKKPEDSNTGVTGGSGGSGGPTTKLEGARLELSDAIAGPESGNWGYEAFNQGGAKGGTKVLGKSGSHKEHFGTSLTDLSLGEIFERQNTQQRGLSMDEHIQSGGLHAVGKYQFIGSTLQDEVSRMGLSLDTKFTPQVQDDIFFSHIKRVGNISPWVGPSIKYGQEKKDYLNGLISQI